MTAEGLTAGGTGVIPADVMVTGTGHRCTADFCGDCADYAALTTALLRVSRITPECVWTAEHSWDIQATNESGAHVYNLLYYRSKWRIVEYGRWRLECGHWHQPTQRYFDVPIRVQGPKNIWNDHFGTRGAELGETGNTSAASFGIENYWPSIRCRDTTPGLSEEQTRASSYCTDYCP